jgi:hypothetical protein
MTTSVTAIVSAAFLRAEVMCPGNHWIVMVDTLKELPWLNLNAKDAETREFAEKSRKKPDRFLGKTTDIRMLHLAVSKAAQPKCLNCKLFRRMPEAGREANRAIASNRLKAQQVGAEGIAGIGEQSLGLETVRRLQMSLAKVVRKSRTTGSCNKGLRRGLNRMQGNLLVRFLGGKATAMQPRYPTPRAMCYAQ